MRGGRGFFLDVHPACFVSISLLWLFNGVRVLLVMLLCLVCHEAGHLFTACLQGRRILGLRVGGMGIELVIQDTPFSYRSDVWLHLSGALSDLLFAFFTVFLIRAHASELRFFALYFHLALFSLQLLPVRGLDGGHALFARLCQKRELWEAQRVCERTHKVCSAVFLTLLFCALVRTSFHMSLSVSFVSALFFLNGPKQKNPPRQSGGFWEELGSSSVGQRELMPSWR